MKVYLLEGWPKWVPEEAAPVGIFSTKEKADAYKEKIQAREPRDQYGVVEYELDPEMPR